MQMNNLTNNIIPKHRNEKWQKHLDSTLKSVTKVHDLMPSEEGQQLIEKLKKIKKDLNELSK